MTPRASGSRSGSGMGRSFLQTDHLGNRVWRCECLAQVSTRSRSVATVNGSRRLCTMALSAFSGLMAVARFRSFADTLVPCWALTSTATGAESSAPDRTEASVCGLRAHDEVGFSTRVEHTRWMSGSVLTEV